MDEGSHKEPLHALPEADSQCCSLPPADLEPAFLVFVRYGFRKTSMGDVAEALGVSRQALYKRYGNKDALFTAVVDGLMTQSFRAAHEALYAPGQPLASRLVQSVDALAGHFVDYLRASPHSVEVIAMVNLEMRDTTVKFEQPYFQARVDLLMNEGVAGDRAHAEDMVVAMTCAAKGLLHTAATHDEFLNGFTRVVRALLPRPAARDQGA